MWARIWVLAVTACFSPQPPAGAPCPDGNCPAGQRCIAQVCTFGEGSDAPSFDAPNDSVVGPDTSIDAPPKRWSLVATDDRGDLQGDASFTLTIPATGTGNLLVVAIETDDEPVTSITDNAGNTYVAAPNSRATNAAETFGIEIWYANDSIAGATSLTANTINTSDLYAVVVWEVAGLAKTNPVDAVGTLSNQGTSTTPDGAQVTATATGDFVVSVVIVQNQISALTANSAFTQDHNTLGNGWGHLTANDVPPGDYRTEWIQSIPGVSCASTVAFRVAP